MGSDKARDPANRQKMKIPKGVLEKAKYSGLSFLSTQVLQETVHNGDFPLERFPGFAGDVCPT